MYFLILIILILMIAITWRSWLPSIIGGQPTTVLEILDDATKQKYAFEIFKNDNHVRPLLERGYNFDSSLVVALHTLIKPTDIMIDIGAHIGTVAIPLSTSVKHVYAFEPQSAIADILQRNIKRNQRTNITVYKHALGSVNISSFLSSKIVDDIGSHDIKSTMVNYGGIQLGTSGEPVMVKTLDSLGLECQILKVDVEGAEPYVFYGARETIKKYRPVICFERNYQKLSINVPGTTFDIVDFCGKLGYKTLIRVGTTNYILIPGAPPTNLKLKIISLPDFARIQNTYQLVKLW